MSRKFCCSCYSVCSHAARTEKSVSACSRGVIKNVCCSYNGACSHAAHTERETSACRGGGHVQHESEEEDEDQEARNKELHRINEELQKADDRFVPSDYHPGISQVQS